MKYHENRSKGSGDMKRTRKCYRQTDGGMDIPITPFHFPAGDKQVTPGAGPFLVTGHNLNKLGRGPLGDATYQIARLLALWFQTRSFFLCFSLNKPNSMLNM